ncbi:MAG: hypothetical protein U0176_27025, partial [Bacteroidia bacterium]
LFAALIGTAVWTVMASSDPARWSLQVNELSQSAQDQVPLRSYTQNYRTMQTEIGAWHEEVVYYAGMITPRDWLILLFVVAQVLGWAYLMAAATYIKNVVAYLIFFAFAILVFVVNSQPSMDGAMFWLINLGLAAVVLGPAFLLQQEIIKMRFIPRLLVFLVATALPFVLQFINGKMTGLHSATANAVLVLVVVTIIYIIFVSNDLTNLLFYAATNFKNPKYRQRFPIIFTFFLVIAAIEFVMLQKQMGWNLLAEGNDISLRPIHLLAIMSVVAVGTKQNMGPLLKNYLPGLPMSHAFAALGLIVMSFIAYTVSLGEYLFLSMIERVTIMLFFFTGIAHFFYIFYNFGPLIRARMNFYFLSMLPRRLMFFFVVIFGIAATVGIEASSNAKSQRLLKETIYNRLADDALLHGNTKEAMIHYKAAVYETRGSVKANYNLAMLEISQSADLMNAREHFRHASDFVPFAPAYLNWSNLEQSDYSPRQAAYVLRDGSKRVRDAHVFNNLAKAYLDIQEPDSAILALKHGLRIEPQNGALYANLSRVYMEYDKVEEAKKFIQAGLDLPKAHRAVVTNALYLNLRHDAQLKVSESLLEIPEIHDSWETNFNFAIDRYQQGDYAGADKILRRGQKEPESYADSIPAGSLRADSLLLDGMLLFERGEIDRALSRMDFIDVNFPQLRPYTNHFLGVSFFGMGVPEMAAAYFRKSVENGRPSDLLAEAQMEFDRGNLDYAYNQLNLARSQDSTLITAASLESAKIQFANGDYFFATLGMEPGMLTWKDWMQVGHAAGQRGNKAAALEALRHVVEEDEKNPAPYVEMAKISLALGDSLAMENLQPAIKLAPKDVQVGMVNARVLMSQGRVSTAAQVVTDLNARTTSEIKDAYTQRAIRTLSAELKAAQGDTAGAIKELDQLRKENPIDPQVVRPLARIYRAKRMDFEGQNMMLEALNINPYNSDFWYEMALFERLLVRPDESGANALRAMTTANSLERVRQISEEFKEEIATFRAEHPDEEVEAPLEDNAQ